MPHDQIVARLRKLGLSCETLPFDDLSSATLALACFPMYMVANVHAWTNDEQFQLPVAGGLPGAEAMREAFAIGRQERGLQISRAHRHVLGGLLTSAKPSDLLVYEYALETLRMYLSEAAAEIGTGLRLGVARSIVAVAKASGEGLFGTGERVSSEEKTCIEQIAETLELTGNPKAAQVLAELNA